MDHLSRLWEFRYFVAGSILREIQSRYRNSLLGAAWVVLPSIAQILIYTLVFSTLIGARLPGVDDGMAYGVYLCAGFVAWGLFTEVLTRSTSIFIDNANMIKKLVFPKVCLIATIIGSAMINFAVILGVLFVFLLAIGWSVNFYVLTLLPLLLIQLLVSCGLGLTLGLINVFLRDVGQLTPVLLNFWFWLTPIVYPVAILPDSVQALVRMNPMTPVVSGYQQIIVYRSMPDMSALWLSAVFGLAMCGVGYLLYRRSVNYLADEL